MATGAASTVREDIRELTALGCTYVRIAGVSAAFG